MHEFDAIVGQVILEHLRCGYEFDARHWQHLHTLYALSEQQGSQLAEVPDPLNGSRQNSSCHGAYIKILLACYARPAELSRPQLQRLDYWLAQWENVVSLERSYTTSRGDAQPLAVDIGSSHGLRSVRLVSHNADMRYLAMVPLSKLLRVKTILLQQGQTPQQLDLGEYSSSDCIESLTFLHQCWCENRNIRSGERNPVSKRVQVCYQPGNIHAQMSGGRPDGTEVSVETWQSQNESIAGAQLTRTDRQQGRLRHNQLIALRSGDSGDFILGATSWVNVARSGNLRVGVRYLPGTPVPVILRTSDASLPVSDRLIAAFLLHAVPELSSPSSLVVPREWFVPGRAIEIQYPDGTMQVASLGFSVERGMDYQRASFALVQCPLDRKHQREGAALPFFAGYLQLGLMAHRDVLDDRKPQAGSAGFARTAAIHPVETFGQARDVLCGNADTAVLHREHRLAVAFEPAQQDRAALRRIADRIAEQIAERAVQFIAVAEQVGRAFDLHLQRMTPAAQQLPVLINLVEQILYIHGFFAQRTLLVFQPRQGQQIRHQIVHAPGLLGHQLQGTTRHVVI